MNETTGGMTNLLLTRSHFFGVGKKNKNPNMSFTHLSPCGSVAQQYFAQKKFYS
jgi:hypothetical protein